MIDIKKFQKKAEDDLNEFDLRINLLREGIFINDN